jgi:hypothetical protein
LIKDYELEVHYHSGKVNVVADALRQKAHCDYLPPVHITEEYSRTRVLPDLSLFNITLTPTLKSEIIAAQNNDEVMGHIKRRMQEGDPKVACFLEDAEGTLLFKDKLVVPKKEALKRRFWTKLIPLGTLLIQIVPRCIMTQGSNFGGQE